MHLMPFTITVALVGDPANPFAPPYEEFFEREWARPYAAREKVELDVEESETLGEVMTRAAAAWSVEVPEDWAGPIAFVGFYRPEDEERFHGWQSSITLVDEHGRAIWNNYWKDVRYGDLLRAADAGVLEGDPLRPYLILHAEIGNGLIVAESILLAVIGGGVGVLAGGAATAVYASTKSWAVVIPAEAWSGGIASAILIGAFAGLMPAIRASRMPPTVALRTV